MPTLNSSYSKLPVYYPDEDPKGAISMAGRAREFMRESVTDKRPFFAYVAHFATHLDLVSNYQTYEHFKNKPWGRKHHTPAYAAMAKDMDTAIGQTLDAVKELGIQDNTYVFIMSDNGGVQHFIQSADGSEELYDHHSDPNKWTNLAANPAHHAVKARLAGLLPKKPK